MSKLHHAPKPIPYLRPLLAVICFIAGAAMMVIEISANRLLAPAFGNSLYTWTALIGVILIAFSIGGYLGGYWADKTKHLRLLGWLLAGSAVLTMLIPVINGMLGMSLANAGLISGPVMISLFLFALPGVLLGAISPASVRFYSMASEDQHVGSAAGTISMLGSLGSFVGTFLSGFVLLSAFGVKAIFLGTGLVLLALALVAFWIARQAPLVHAKAAGIAAVAFALGLSSQEKLEAGVLYQQNSFYHRIEVLEDKSSSGTNRYLKLDSTMEGGMNAANGDLILNYQRYWKLAQLNDKLKIQRALFIGAGAFGMPEQVARLGKDVNVDVVEIDPAVIETGRRYFKLNEFPNVQAHASDARRFLNQSKEKYDLVFGDAYNGIRHIPAHLVTKEFYAEVQSKLSPDGVFLMNVISAVEGPQAELLGSIISTLQAVFPNVEVFAAGGARTDAQNVILLCSNTTWKPWLEERFYLPSSWQGALTGTRIPSSHWPQSKPVFTDDWNPVDSVIARQLLK